METQLMKGKTCLITGATSGHGWACAMELAQMGAKIVPLGRNRQRLETFAREMEQRTGRQPLEPVVCDLSSLCAVQKAGEELSHRGNPIHVLINNAGVVKRHRAVTVDGYETTFAVNYLAHFYLTRKVLPLLIHDAPARIINVSSDTHRIVSLPLYDLNAERKYSWLKAYSHSKLAMVYFTLELHRRLNGTLVSVNAVDPGPVESRIGQDNPGITAALLPWVMKAFFPSAAKAAQTAVYLASSQELSGGSSIRGISGKYFRSMVVKKPSIHPKDTSISRRLWYVSEQLVDAVVTEKKVRK